MTDTSWDQHSWAKITGNLGKPTASKKTQLGNIHFLKQKLMKSEYSKLFMMLLLRNYYSSPKKRILLRADLSHNKHPSKQKITGLLRVLKSRIFTPESFVLSS